MSYNIGRSSCRRFLIQAALQRRLVPSPKTVSPVVPLSSAPGPQSVLCLQRKVQAAGVPCCATEQAPSTTITGSSVVSISQPSSDQLSCLQNILWLGSITSLSHSHLSLMSMHSVSSGEIFHLCYHLPVIFSHYPVVQSKSFQSFQLSFNSLGKVFCVALIVAEREWKWIVATSHCEFWNKGGRVEFVQHINLY